MQTLFYNLPLLYYNGNDTIAEKSMAFIFFTWFKVNPNCLERQQNTSSSKSQFEISLIFNNREEWWWKAFRSIIMMLSARSTKYKHLQIIRLLLDIINEYKNEIKKRTTTKLNQNLKQTQLFFHKSYVSIQSC